MSHKMKFYGLTGFKMERQRQNNEDDLAKRNGAAQRYRNATFREPFRPPWLAKQSKAEKQKEIVDRRHARREAKFEQEFGPERKFWRALRGIEVHQESIMVQRMNAEYLEDKRREADKRAIATVEGWIANHIEE